MTVKFFVVEGFYICIFASNFKKCPNVISSFTNPMVI